MAMSFLFHEFPLSYLQRLPPQNMEHFISLGVFRRKLSPVGKQSSWIKSGQGRIVGGYQGPVEPLGCLRTFIPPSQK